MPRRLPIIARSDFSERRIDFSSVKMLASIFFEISDRQYSIAKAGFSRVSNCHRTRNGLAEYPDAPATQTISPLQSIRIRLTFLLGEPRQNIEGNTAAAVQQDNSLGQIGVAAKKQIGLSLLRIMGQTISNFERAAMNSQRHPMPGRINAG